MVKKLFKHEFASYLRVFLPLQLVVVGAGALVRLLGFFASDTPTFNILLTCSILIYILSILAGTVGTLVLGVRRFYKNLFTAEGYLSLTLPVTQTQHIMVKAVTAVVMQVFAFLVMLVSVCLATSGELLAELIKAAQYLITTLLQKVDTVHLFFHILEGLLLVIATTFLEYLLIYTCIALGQLAKKHRVLLAFGIYYGYYVLCQIFVSVVQVALVFLTEASPKWFESLLTFMQNNIYTSIHIGMLGLLLFTAVHGLVCFVITRHVLCKKLDLE